MKLKFLLILIASLTGTCYSFSQKALLEFGQMSHEAWPAKYFHAQNSSDQQPPENWFAADFDDSEWETLRGPVSSENCLPYYNTPWGDMYAGYFVRRTFTVEDPDELHNLYVHTMHDDGCDMYLNGELIYQNTGYHSVPDYTTFLLDQERKKLVVKGKNVLAVWVRDTRGGEAMMDFGLYDYKAPLVANHSFESGTNGWNLTGEGFAHGGDDTNRILRNQSTKKFDVSQSFKGTEKGLYLLKVQAFQMQGADQNPWQYHGSVPVTAKIYINDTEKTINNVFDEGLKENIYGGSYYILTPDNEYFPNRMEQTSVAFSRDMYDNELYAYVDADSLNIGVHVTDPTKLNAWTCLDNFRLQYFDEADLDNLYKESVALEGLPMSAECKGAVSALLADYKNAKTYADKCSAIVRNSGLSKEIKKSVAQYSVIGKLLDSIAAKSANAGAMSESVRNHASALTAAVKSEVSKGTYGIKDAAGIIEELNAVIGRMDLRHLTIAVTTPGSLGDSILSHVEYFDEVESLKISGTLNDNDLSTIQGRLTSLREIDMTDVVMKDLPKSLFRENMVIREVALPSSLRTIEEYAFESCIHLRHVAFGNELTIIGRYAFENCVRLEDINFPPTLKTIREYAFDECYSLPAVELPDGFTTMGNGAFRYCPNLRSVTLPSTLSVIPTDAFYNHQLTEINFSEGLVTIGEQAFRTYENTYNRGGVERVSVATSLKNVKFPKTLRTIGSNAFAYNRGLEDVAFNEGLNQIGDNAFYDCDGLKEVTLPSSLVLCYASPFDYCDNLMKVTCLSVDPPYMTDQIPYGLGMEGRALYVPALSVNTYKQTKGWDKFPTIEPIDVWPENIAVHDDLRLTLPETISPEFKPNVSIVHDQKGTSYLVYGSLTVNGEGTLSMKQFNTCWDPNYQYHNSNRVKNYCSLVNNSRLRADSVAVQLYTPNNIWTFVSFPYDVKASEIIPTESGSTNWVVRRYDGAKRAAGENGGTWVRLSETDVLNAGEGYIIQSSRYLDNYSQDHSGFCVKALNNGNKNNIFRTEDAEVALNEYLSEFSHNRSWNLIGNPYPCYYDTRFMDFTAPITVWNMNNRTYRAYSPVDDSYILLPGEAFFVQRPVDVEKITFSKEGRQTDREVRPIEAHAMRAPADIERSVINLSVSDAGATDATRIVVNPSASMGYELDKDANKFMSTDKTVPQIYSSFNGVDYSINERPLDNGIVNLTLYAGTEGLHTISLGNEVAGFKVILEDLDNGSASTLSADHGYDFFATEGTHDGRFRLRLVNEATGVDGVDRETEENGSIYTIDGVEVSSPVENGIYIRNGKKIMLNN